MTNNILQSRVDNCTFIKTVLMLTVVFFHSILFYGGTGWFSVIEPRMTIAPVSLLANWLSTFHVYGFVLTSGYLYSYLRYEKNKYLVFRDFFKNKVRRLLIPYAFVSLVWAIPIGQLFFHYSLIDILNKYALGTSPSQLWFLLMLFGVFVLLWPLSNKVHNSILFSFSLSVLLYCLGMIGEQILSNYFQIWSTLKFVVFFVVGMKLRDAHIKGKLLNPKWYTVAFVFLVDIFLCFIKTKIDNLWLESIIGVTLKIMGALLSFFVLQAIASRINERIKNKKLYWLLSNSSMIIYLFHQQFVYVSIATFNNLINPYIVMIISFVIAMLFSCIIAKIVGLSKTLTCLVGGRV